MDSVLVYVHFYFRHALLEVMRTNSKECIVRVYIFASYPAIIRIRFG